MLLKTQPLPWVSGGFLERKIPGKNGEGTTRTMVWGLACPGDSPLDGPRTASGTTWQTWLGRVMNPNHCRRFVTAEPSPLGKNRWRIPPEFRFSSLPTLAQRRGTPKIRCSEGQAGSPGPPCKGNGHPHPLFYSSHHKTHSGTLLRFKEWCRSSSGAENAKQTWQMLPESPHRMLRIPHVAMGQNPVPPVNIPILPTKRS